MRNRLGLLAFFLKVDELSKIIDEEKPIFDNIQVIKAAFATYGKVEFVDDKFSETSYVLRFENPEGAQSALEALNEGAKIAEETFKASIIEGEDETKYIESINTSRNNAPNKKRKFNNNNKRKRRD